MEVCEKAHMELLSLQLTLCQGTTCSATLIFSALAGIKVMVGSPTNLIPLSYIMNRFLQLAGTLVFRSDMRYAENEFKV